MNSPQLHTAVQYCSNLAWSSEVDRHVHAAMGVTMRIIDNLDEMTETARGWLASGTVGLVCIRNPLHSGHQALLRAARQHCEILVVALLDNHQLLPEPSEQKCTSRDLLQEIRALGGYAIDVIFIPRITDLYPSTFSTYIIPDGSLASHLERGYEPATLRVLTTTLIKLFHLIRPDIAFFGQKNVLLVAFLRQIIHDFNIDVRLRTLPTRRDADGLVVCKSKLQRSPIERQAAIALYQALFQMRLLIEEGKRDSFEIANTLCSLLGSTSQLEIEAVSLCQQDTFLPVTEMVPGTFLIIEGRMDGIPITDNLLWMNDGRWSL